MFEVIGVLWQAVAELDEVVELIKYVGVIIGREKACYRLPQIVDRHGNESVRRAKCAIEHMMLMLQQLNMNGIQLETIMAIKCIWHHSSYLLSS